MKSYLDLIKDHLLFFVLFMGAILAASAMAITHKKIGCFIELNKLHNHLLDLFFIVVTYLGDGTAAIIFSVVTILFWRQYKLGVQLLLAYLVSGIVAQLLKNIFAAPRPKAIISDGVYHYFIAGVTRSGWNSFPSGHTTSIFAIVTILILYFKNTTACFLLLLTAVLVGYSRIYLGQHFLDDVIAGSILGVITSLIIYCNTSNKEWPSRLFKIKKEPTATFGNLL